MKIRLKLISKYIMQYIFTIMFFGLISLIIVRFTIFNENFILRELDKNNYYNELYSMVYEEMSNYVIQSGLDEEIINDIYTEEMLVNDTNSLINYIYNGESKSYDTKVIENNLRENVEDYLLKHDIKNDDKDAINKFIKQIVNVYENKIDISDKLNEASGIFQLGKKILNIGTILLFIIVSILYLVMHFYYKDESQQVVLFTSGILIIFGYFYVVNNFDINNIIIFNEVVSNVIIGMIYNILNKFLFIAGLLFILGIIIKIMNIKMVEKGHQVNILIFLLWIIIIFSFSSQSGADSTITSNSVTDIGIKLVENITNKEFSDKEIENIQDNMRFIIRKSAHFTEYLILGLILINLLRKYYKLNYKVIISAILLCMLVASCDEFYQLFIGGRTGKFSDVLIDTSGSSVGIIIYSLIYKLVNRKRVISKKK